MTDDRHNGWTNYATWRVNLEICDDICSSLIGEQTFSSVYDLAEYLKEECEQAIEGYPSRPGSETGYDLAISYARAFLSDVNWFEIAEANADELVRSEDEEADE